jgi:hypothetical protein
MLQLDPILVKELEQEAMGRSCESALMEVRKGHHVAIWRSLEPLIVKKDPLKRVNPCGQEPMMDETQHVRIFTRRAALQIHGGKLWRAEDFGYSNRIRSLAGGGGKSEEG